VSAADRLAEIEDRANAATRGPWSDFWPDQCCRYRCVEPVMHDIDVSRWDAEFIAAARQDVPALVAALRAVLDIPEAPVEDAIDAEDLFYKHGLDVMRDKVHAAIEGALS
jgi:hypothetical protein